MKKTLIILSCIGFLFSCGSDDGGTLNERSGKHEADRKEFSEVKMYTINGEVNDQDVIIDYIDRNDLGEEGYFNTMSNVENAYEDISINFISEEVVNINDEEENRDLREVNDYLCLEARDTISYFKSTIPVVSKLEKQVPLYREEGLVSGVSGGDYIVFEKHCYYIKVEEGVVKMPQISFYLSEYFGGYSSSSLFVGGLNNEFNEEAYQYLQVNDTLLVQENDLVFKR